MRTRGPDPLCRLALGELQKVPINLRESFVRERSGVRPEEISPHPFFARLINELQALRFLVGAQAFHKPHAGIDRLDDLQVVVHHLIPHLAKQVILGCHSGVVGHAPDAIRQTQGWAGERLAV